MLQLECCVRNAFISARLTRQDASKFAVDRSSNTMYYFKKKGNKYQLKQEPANLDRPSNGIGMGSNIFSLLIHKLINAES